MRVVALLSTDTVVHLPKAIDDASAGLALLPERWCGGEAAAAPELSDGGLARAVAAVAVQKHCAIVAPYIERECQRRFSSLLFVGADGRGLCSYRKTHLGPDDIHQGVTRGNWLTIVPHGGERIGMLLGEDLLYPEMSRCLAMAGATLLIAATSIEPAMLAALVRVRALENGLPVLAIAGGPYGRVVAADPEGRLLADAATPFAFDLDAVAEERLRRRIASRRAELYRGMQDPGPIERP